MKVSPAFSKAAGCRGGALARAPQSAESPCAYVSAGGGLRGNPRRGFPLFLSLPCTCAPLRWVGVVAMSCHSTPFLWCLPKETVSSRQRKALFLPRYLHHPRERYCFVDGTFLARLGEGVGGCLSPYLRRGRTGLVMAALRGRSTERASLYFYASAYHQSAFLWGSTPFLCARAKKWGGTGSRGRRLLPKETAHP